MKRVDQRRRRLRSHAGRRSGRWRRSDPPGRCRTRGASPRSPSAQRARTCRASRRGSRRRRRAPDRTIRIGTQSATITASASPGTIGDDRVAVRPHARRRRRALPLVSGRERRCRAPASRASSDRSSDPTDASAARQASGVGQRQLLRRKQVLRRRVERAAAQARRPKPHWSNEMRDRARQRHRRRPSHAATTVVMHAAIDARTIAGFRSDSRWHRL